MTPIVTCSLRMTPMGKERPRVTRFGTFMPKPYEAWRSMVRLQVRAQMPRALLARLPLQGRLAWSCTFQVPRGEMGPDLDNAIGALWDAIQVPPIKRGKNGLPRGGGWGLVLNDKQFRRIDRVEITDGPTRITFTLTEI